MAVKLRIKDIRVVLSSINEVTKAFQLGIQLDIDPTVLKTIEKDYPGDSDRQKAEVIEYWLRNSPDASWTTLANAVERMGAHTNLVERLKMKQTSEQLPLRETRRRKSKKPTRTLSYNSCVRYNVLILGKVGHGKSMLGNKLLNSDGCFELNNQICPRTHSSWSVIDSETQFKSYMVTTFDHDGLFEGKSTMRDLSSDIQSLHLVLFVLKCELHFDAREREILESVMREWQISRISALVLTHCERLSEEEREKMVEQFKKDHPSLAKLMGKGVLAVGFPGSSHVTEMNESVEDDKAKLRQLIYSCDDPVFIPQPSPQNESRRRFRCSIL